MSREMKYRGLTEYGKWVFGGTYDDYIVQDTKDIDLSCVLLVDRIIRVIPETIGQYITKDDYNNDVYEGDIKQLIETYLGSFDTVTHLKAVYLENEYKFVWMDINDETNIYEINEALNCKTIGNVSEHLKLLKDI